MLSVRFKKLKPAERLDVEMLRDANTFTAINMAEDKPTPAKLPGGLTQARFWVENHCQEPGSRVLVYGMNMRGDLVTGQVLITPRLLTVYDELYNNKETTVCQSQR